jgi:hypothetical protein
VEDDSFTVSSPGGSIRVGTDSLAYDPLDDTGYQRVQKGDFVLVRGDLNTGFFDTDRELQASTIVVLQDASKRISSDTDRVSSTEATRQMQESTPGGN